MDVNSEVAKSEKKSNDVFSNREASTQLENTTAPMFPKEKFNSSRRETHADVPMPSPPSPPPAPQQPVTGDVIVIGDFSGDAALKEAYMITADEASQTPPRTRGGCCGCFMCVINSFSAGIHKVFPPGGVLSSALTLASGAIGAGILGLPGAMNSCGMILALIYLVLFSCFTVFSMRMIAHASLKTGVRSFEGILKVLFPAWYGAFSYWAAFIRWFFTMGCCVGYVISVMDTFKPIFKGAMERDPGNGALMYFGGNNGLKLLAFLVWICCMVPLVIPKHVDSLRYASFAAIALMLYFCVIIVVHSCMHGLQVHRHNIKLSGNQDDDTGNDIYLFRTGNRALGELGTFMFSYIIQGNAVEVTWDLRPEIRSVSTITKAAILAMIITFVIYTFVSVFGYFDFGAKDLATNSMMLMYRPLDEPEVMVAYVGVLVKLCVAYALMHLAARNAVYYVLGWTERYRKARPKKSKKASNPLGDEDSHEGEAEGHHHHGSNRTFVDNIPMWQHLLVVIILSGICLILGLFIPSINIVFGFAGSICGGFMAFIFPALMFIYSGGFTPKRTGWVMFIMAIVLLICGVVGIVFGTGSAIYGLANKAPKESANATNVTNILAF